MAWKLCSALVMCSWTRSSPGGIFLMPWWRSPPRLPSSKHFFSLSRSTLDHLHKHLSTPEHDAIPHCFGDDRIISDEVLNHVCARLNDIMDLYGCRFLRFCERRRVGFKPFFLENKKHIEVGGHPLCGAVRAEENARTCHFFERLQVLLPGSDAAFTGFRDKGKPEHASGLFIIKIEPVGLDVCDGLDFEHAFLSELGQDLIHT